LPTLHQHQAGISPHSKRLTHRSAGGWGLLLGSPQLAIADQGQLDFGSHSNPRESPSLGHLGLSEHRVHQNHKGDHHFPHIFPLKIAHFGYPTWTNRYLLSKNSSPFGLKKPLQTSGTGILGAEGPSPNVDGREDHEYCSAAPELRRFSQFTSASKPKSAVKSPAGSYG